MEVIVPILIIIFLLSLNLKKTNKVSLELISLTLIFLLAFTQNMGIDWTHYKDFYLNVVNKVKLTDITFETAFYENGYVVLNYIFYNLGVNYDIFMGILRGSCLYFIFKILYKNSENYLFSLVIIITGFIFTYTTEPIIRQLIAVTISYYSIENLIRKKYILYIFYGLVAYQFHSSAIVCFFYIFFCYIKLNLKIMIILLSISELVILNLNKILDLLIKFNSNFSKYKGYVDSIGEKSLSIMGIILLFIILILYIKPIVSIKNIETRRNKLYINFLYIYLMILILAKHLVFLSRFESYFFIGVSIILSKFNEIKLLNLKLKKNILISLISILNIFLLSFTILKSELDRYKYMNYSNYVIEVLKNSFELESEITQIKKLKEYRKEYFKLKNKVISTKYKN